MTHRTITLVAPNGAKVRTVHSKRFFVVRFGSISSRYNPNSEGREFIILNPPEPYARVEKRTDSAKAAFIALNKLAGQGRVYEVGYSNGERFVAERTPSQLHSLGA